MGSCWPATADHKALALLLRMLVIVVFVILTLFWCVCLTAGGGVRVGQAGEAQGCCVEQLQ